MGMEVGDEHGQLMLQNTCPVKKDREKAFQMVITVHHQLKMSTGQGLDQFLVTPSMVGTDPFLWKRLQLCSDQGSDLESLCHFLKAHDVLLERAPDINHAAHNDVKLGMAAGYGFWSQIVLSTLVYSVNHRRWTDATWWQQLKGIMDAFFSLNHPDTEVLFNVSYLEILTDMHLEHRVHEPNFKEEIWQYFRRAEFIQKVGEKIFVSRWFQMLKASRDSLRHWGMRKVAYTVLNLQLQKQTTKEYSKMQAQLSAVAEKMAKEDRGAEKQSLAEGRREAERQRELCQNGLLLCCQWYNDSDRKRREQMIVNVSDPIHNWYSQQSHELRSTLESSSWITRQLRGEALQSLEDTIAVLQNQPVLKNMSFMRLPTRSMREEGRQHAIVIAENTYAAQAANFSFKFVAQRSKRLGYLFRGIPGSFHKLADESEATRAGCMHRFKELHQLFHTEVKARKDNDKFWRDVWNRSTFHHQDVKQICEIRALENWDHNSTRIREWFEERSRSLLVSKATEDGIRLLRRGEQSGYNTSQSWRRMYWNLMRSWFLHVEHRYDEVPGWKEHNVGPTALNLDPIFKPLAEDAGLSRIPFRKIMDKKATWFTTTPGGSQCHTSDLQVMQQCNDNNCWEDAKNSWLAQFFMGPSNVLVRHSTFEETGEWVFPIGEFGGNIMMGIRAIELPFTIGGEQCYAPSMSGQVPLDCNMICDITDRKALPIRWVTPLEQRLEGFPESKLQICACAKGPEKELLALSAEQCFFGLHKEWLCKLADHCGIDDVHCGQRLQQVLSTMLCALLSIDPKTEAGV